MEERQIPSQASDYGTCIPRGSYRERMQFAMRMTYQHSVASLLGFLDGFD